jgi:peptidoglycan/xylan/chitin deacetylase (PgdA/CDA1 family)
MRTIAFLFHDVVPAGRLDLSGFQGRDADIYKLDFAQFERHLKALAGAGGREFRSVLDPESAEATRLLLTFDDGGLSALDTAALLERFGWTGHFLVTTGRIGTTGFLNASQIRQLRDRGHVVGSHSSSHPARMSRCTPEELDREWAGSRRALEEILQEPVTVASVPGGYYSRRVAAAAARAGLHVLFNSEPTTGTAMVDGCAVIGRFSVQQGVGEQWVAAVAAGRVLPRLERLGFWTAKKLLKAVFGERWLSIRKRILARRQPG